MFFLQIKPLNAPKILWNIFNLNATVPIFPWAQMLHLSSHLLILILFLKTAYESPLKKLRAHFKSLEVK